MAGYRQSRPEKAKAAAAAVIVHLAIGAAFLTGLATDVAQRQSDALQTFDVTPPPPIVDVQPDDSAPSGDPGEAGVKAEPTPVVAPEPEIAVPAIPPIAAAPVPGQGAAPSAGAAAAGTGTGAGGSGQGLGGGGSGAGRSPAVLISGTLNRRDVRQFAALGLPVGRADLDLVISPQGSVQYCQILKSSGLVRVDEILCRIAGQRFRFRPARERDGRPIGYRINYHANWR